MKITVPGCVFLREITLHMRGLDSNSKPRLYLRSLDNLVLDHIQKKPLVPGRQGRVNIHKSLNMIHCTNRMEQKTIIIIPIVTEKAFHEIQLPFLIKILSELGIKGIYLNMIKIVYDKPT